MAALTAVCGLIFLVALADAAVSDLLWFRIANRGPIMLILAGTAALLATPDPMVWIGHGAAGLLLLVVGGGLFAAGLWGGGDAKLLAAVALWTGFEGLDRLMLVMALTGGTLALLVLAARRRRLRGIRSGEPVIGSRIPYGVAIAVAGLDWWTATILPRLASL